MKVKIKKSDRPLLIRRKVARNLTGGCYQIHARDRGRESERRKGRMGTSPATRRGRLSSLSLPCGLSQALEKNEGKHR
jgi:hypothetical protein